MAHYFFDLKNGVTKRDHSGLELDNDLDAIAQAQSIAKQIGAKANHHSRHVTIVHETGREVLRVKVAVDPAAKSAPEPKKIP